MSAAAREKFGKGYQGDAEKSGEFSLSDKFVKYAKDGSGGAVRVHGYAGRWPLFGRPSERLGGPDVIAVPNDGGSASSSSTPIHFVTRPKWMCRPKSACMPCDTGDLQRPYCQPYGNHVVVECRRVETMTPPERRPKENKKVAENAAPKRPINGNVGDTPPDPDRRSSTPDGLFQIADDVYLDRRWAAGSNSLEARQELFVGGHVYKGYQTCGRDRRKEAIDYSEFLIVNLVLALAAIYVLLSRQKYLAGRHQSMLARRIGRN